MKGVWYVNWFPCTEGYIVVVQLYLSVHLIRSCGKPRRGFLCVVAADRAAAAADGGGDTGK